MDLALLIAIVALAMAIPSAIDASWNVIIKIRALKKKSPALPTLDSLKKVIRSGLNRVQLQLFLKQATLFHQQKSVRATYFTVLTVALFALISFPPPTAFAPEKSKYFVFNPKVSISDVPKREYMILENTKGELHVYMIKWEW